MFQNPQWLAAVRAEIDEAQEAGLLSNPITLREAQHLKVYEAVSKEAQRMHSSVGWHLPRHVPKGGANVAGYDLPAGARVGMSIRALHFNKDAFGPDAELFRPERWFGERSAESQKYYFQVSLSVAVHVSAKDLIANCAPNSLAKETTTALART